MWADISGVSLNTWDRCFLGVPGLLLGTPPDRTSLRHLPRSMPRTGRPHPALFWSWDTGPGSSRGIWLTGPHPLCTGREHTTVSMDPGSMTTGSFSSCTNGPSSIRPDLYFLHEAMVLDWFSSRPQTRVLRGTRGWDCPLWGLKFKHD